MLEHRRERLHGRVNLAVPVSWLLVGLVFFISVVAALIFLSLAEYSRVETVTGIVSPEGGVARIVSQRSGTLAELVVHEGQTVDAGDPLALVQTGETLASGIGSTAEVLASLGRQETGLLAQKRQLAASASAQRAQMVSRIGGLESEIDALGTQIRVQEGLVDSANTELKLARKVAERGFVSRRDLLQREEVYSNRQLQLSQLRQSRSSQVAAIEEARGAIAQSDAATGAQISALAAQQSDIAQSRTAAEAATATRLTAPMAGKVTALTARTGQSIAVQEPIMLLVPMREALRAELYVPTAAVGFLEEGQEVRVGLDAFPFQRFGTLPARVTSIASAPVAQQGPDGNPVPVYLVVAQLSRQSMEAYGKREQLIAGMTLTARIVTERQSLLKWLFAPLFAVGKR